MAFNEYADYDGLGLAELVAKGEVSASELAEEAISRIEKHNPTLNAVVTKLYDMGREAAKAPAKGPFSGVPFLLKDILGDVAGVETRSGSRLMQGLPAPTDNTLTQRFKAAGVSILGKTNVPEFGLLPITESERDYKVANGLETLEQSFETFGLEYWDPLRQSIV